MSKRTYITDAGEDRVEVYANGTFATFTRGTRNALYRGEDAEAARKSLELSEDDWAGLLASDAEDED